MGGSRLLHNSLPSLNQKVDWQWLWPPCPNLAEHLLLGCFGGGSNNGALPPELLNGAAPAAGDDPLAAFPPAPNDPVPKPTTAETVATETTQTAPKANCEALVEDLEQSIVDMNFCQADSDCVVGEGLCPFGCYLFHNKSIDFADYKPALDEYRDNCSPCTYKCASSPRAADRRCRNGRCVDVRYDS